jgi:hypothetical protein
MCEVALLILNPECNTLQKMSVGDVLHETLLDIWKPRVYYFNGFHKVIIDFQYSYLNCLIHLKTFKMKFFIFVLLSFLTSISRSQINEVLIESATSF